MSKNLLAKRKEFSSVSEDHARHQAIADVLEDIIDKAGSGSVDPATAMASIMGALNKQRQLHQRKADNILSPILRAICEAD